MNLSAELSTPEFSQDPYPFYARWRLADPLLFDSQLGWFATRYADAAAMLRDPRFHVCKPTLAPGREDAHVQQLRTIVHKWLMCENPPDHTRVRRLVNYALTPAFVADLHASIDARTEEVLDECAARKTFDLLSDAAVPIAVRVIADALGLPRQDAAAVKRWSVQVAPVMDGTLRTALVDRCAQALAEMVEYLNPLIKARQAEPGDDLISRLFSQRDPNDAEPSHSDVLATCVLLLVAGHETTSSLIGSGLVALLHRPGELRRLREDPGLAALAIEEFLRFDSPVQLTTRVPVSDVMWDGRTLAKGVAVNLILGAANRDPAQFADPDRLDVGRIRNPHLAFSAGIHFCPGAGMARLVGRNVIARILHRFPDLRLGADAPVRNPGVVLRGFVSVPVRI